MIETFKGFNPVLQAFLAGSFTWGLTALGASAVFFFKSLNRKVMDAMLGFTAGVMIAASYWSLLAPAIEMSESSNLPKWLPPSIGFVLGGSLLYFMDDFKETKNLSKKDIIASYQQAIIDVLIKKVTTAMKINKVDKCVIAGGVAANQCLRNGLSLVLGDNKIMFPDLSYCTDNGAMISYLGEKKLQSKKYESLSFSSQPNLKLS